MKKTLLLSICAFYSFTSFGQSPAEKAFKKNEKDFRKSIPCIGKGEYIYLKSAIITQLKKDWRLSEEDYSGSFGEFFGMCHISGASKLVETEYNFGTGASMTNAFFLVGRNKATELKLIEPNKKILNGLDRVDFPRLLKFEGNNVLFSMNVFKEDDAGCCPSYEAQFQYVISGNKLIPVSMSELKKQEQQ